MGVKRKYYSASGPGYWSGRYPGAGSMLVPARRPRNPFKRPPPPPRVPSIRMGSAVRRGIKSGRSYTLTKTKKRQKFGKVYSHGDNASFSYNTITGKSNLRNFRSLASRVVNPQTIRANGASNWTVGYGVQSVNVLGFMSKSQLTAIKTAANAGSATDNNVKLFLKTGQMKISFRNCSNTNMRVTLYDIVTKKMPPATTLDSPTEAWVKGLTDFNVTNTNTTVGMTPLKSPEFREYFAINKATSLSLEPGQEHQHTVNHKWNKLINSTVFDNAASESIPGLTRWFMLVFHGTLGHEALDASTVTTASGKLDYMFTSQYSYGYLNEVKPSFANTNTLDTTITTFQFMGESGDADTDNMAA